MDASGLVHCLEYLAEAARIDTCDFKTYGGVDLATLPPPARRYFKYAIAPFQPAIRRARLSWAGTFQARPNGGWLPFSAEQTYSTAPRGFVWTARIGRIPGLRFRVRDAYADGAGSISAHWAGIPLMRRRGSPELASASLLRFLTEAVWLPTALLPGPDCRWDPVDDNRARVTLTDRGLSVAMTVEVDSPGRIVSVRAERFRDTKAGPVLTPWVGRFGEYKSVAGMMVPAHAEVEWELPDGPAPYWRGALVAAEYTC